MRHLILTAFGTTTRARQTYDLIDNQIRPRFAGCRIHWAFSSPSVRKSVQHVTGSATHSLSDLLATINQDSSNRLVIQSLHVTPGHEFHRTVRLSGESRVPTSIGMPLLTTPDDFHQVSRCLLPLISNSEEPCVLLLGHGTSHPSWTAYPALEKIVRQYVDKRVFVSTLEQYPDSATLIDEISAEGHRQVLVIPLLMVAGMHFKRDIIGDGERSWKSRLRKRKIAITFHDQGLGKIGGISDIFSDHIQTAFDALDQS